MTGKQPMQPGRNPKHCMGGARVSWGGVAALMWCLSASGPEAPEPSSHPGALRPDDWGLMGRLGGSQS